MALYVDESFYEHVDDATPLLPLPSLLDYSNDYKSNSFKDDMDLVAFVGKDRESWGQITALVNRMECDNIFLVLGEEARDFPESEKCERIEVESSASILELKKEMMEKIKAKIGNEFEVAVSIASGNGKEHMALISALLSVPVGIRLVVYTKEGVQFLT